MYVLRRARRDDLDACRKLWADRSDWAGRHHHRLQVCQLTDAECAAAEVLVLTAEDCVIAAVTVIDQTPGAGWSPERTQQEAVGLALMVTSPAQRTNSLSRLLVRWAGDFAARTGRGHVRAAVSSERLALHLRTRQGWEWTGTHTRNAARTALLQHPAAHDNQIPALVDDRTAQVPGLSDSLTARELIGAATSPHRPPTPRSTGRPTFDTEGLHMHEVPQPTEQLPASADQHTATENTPPTAESLGLPRIPRSKRLVGAEAQEFADQVAHAYLVLKASTPLIAEATGRSASAIQNTLLRRGVTLRPAGFLRPVVKPKPEAHPRRPHESAIQAVQYTALGNSGKWISDHLGVSSCTVEAWLRGTWCWLGGTGRLSRTCLVRLAVLAELIDAPPDPGVRPVDTDPEHLTVLHCIARGMTGAEIADATAITQSQKQITQLRRQFGAVNAAHLVYLASSLITDTAADCADAGTRS